MPGLPPPRRARTSAGHGQHSRARGAAIAKGALRVPEITAVFWVLKGLSTAMGESTSDYLVHAIAPELAVGIGFIGFCAALALVFSRRTYTPLTYWFAVVMVGVFGTMAADVLHVALGVPYLASTALYGAALVVVFVAWARTEPTISIHSINTSRRAAFYWAAVVATFAMGTALGDLTAITLHLGYLASIACFAGLIALPAVGARHLGWNVVGSFWFAYVLTRPLGASIADFAGKPTTAGGLGLGDGWVALVLTVAIAAIVVHLARSRAALERPGGAVPAEP